MGGAGVAKARPATTKPRSGRETLGRAVQRCAASAHSPPPAHTKGQKIPRMIITRVCHTSPRSLRLHHAEPNETLLLQTGIGNDFLPPFERTVS